VESLQGKEAPGRRLEMTTGYQVGDWSPQRKKKNKKTTHKPLEKKVRPRGFRHIRKKEGRLKRQKTVL